MYGEYSSSVTVLNLKICQALESFEMVKTHLHLLHFYGLKKQKNRYNLTEINLPSNLYIHVFIYLIYFIYDPE